ncbi:DUF4337 domain-containing protein [Niveibacterium umoris]|uniref:DUF4337 domain-containing protein n=1 Tax=Niveibacterium umoris TaxID=1193620 RepID=A0A840BHR3_9RHOO|nr:DUF4337 domain-containing protein [Niveibacterium umoris]MBB4012510.1 hypothetical protein [Niveibacterium umoris]
MSGDHFHVHGPHDHAVEHAGHGGDDFASQIAVMTAILATVGALFSYQGGATQNDAMLHKNQAAILKTEAANQWAYYQSKGNKQNMAELGAVLTSDEHRNKFEDDVARYKAEKEEIKKKAEALEEKVKAEDELSEASMHVHHRWAQAMTAIQIAISLAAITLLTRKKWLKYGAWGTAAFGAALAALAIAHI